MIVVLTDEQIARYQAALVGGGNIVPADVVTQMVQIGVQAVQDRIDFDNQQAIRSYLGGKNDDGTDFVGAWPFWLARYQNAPPSQQPAILAQEPQPPMQEVIDLTGAWPVGVLSNTALCPKPQMPTAPTGIFIGAQLSVPGWYATVQGESSPYGTLVNFGGKVLQHLNFGAFGSGWWAPAPAGTSLTGLPVATAAPPIPTGGAQ
jgi:hypothetical protein